MLNIEGAVFDKIVCLLYCLQILPLEKIYPVLLF